jgi:protein phosphatase
MRMQCRLLASETRIGRLFGRNYDRSVTDEGVPLLAVIDSENDDGTTGDIVVRKLAEAREALRRAAERSGDALQEALLATLREAHQTMFTIPRGAPGSAGGSSVTLLACAGGTAVVVHVGDGRLYVKQDEGWVRKTTDHTMLEGTRAAGIAPTEASNIGWQLGIITRVVGVVSKLEVDAFQLPVNQRLTVLLCTRGAWMPLDPGGEAKPLPGSLDGADVARFVWDRYVEDGERDNATVVVAQLTPST